MLSIFLGTLDIILDKARSVAMGLRLTGVILRRNFSKNLTIAWLLWIFWQRGPCQVLKGI